MNLRGASLGEDASTSSNGNDIAVWLVQPILGVGSLAGKHTPVTERRKFNIRQHTSAECRRRQGEEAGTGNGLVGALAACGEGGGGEGGGEKEGAGLEPRTFGVRDLAMTPWPKLTTARYVKKFFFFKSRNPAS